MKRGSVYWLLAVLACLLAVVIGLVFLVATGALAGFVIAVAGALGFSVLASLRPTETMRALVTIVGSVVEFATGAWFWRR
jgi:hypothetical protein